MTSERTEKEAANEEQEIDVMYRLLALLGYWSPLMSLVAGYASYQKSKYALFHSIQGGILNVLLIIFLQIQMINPETQVVSLLFLASWLLAVVLFLSLIVLMFTSFFAKSRWQFPLIGKLASHLTDKWYSPKDK